MLDSCERCRQGKTFSVILAAVDASVFLEVNEENTSPSLITKVFLDKEIFNPSREFYRWNHYVDVFFQDSLNTQVQEESLDLLLGNQRERKFLFGPSSPLDNLY